MTEVSLSEQLRSIARRIGSTPVQVEDARVCEHAAQRLDLIAPNLFQCAFEGMQVAAGGGACTLEQFQAIHDAKVALGGRFAPDQNVPRPSKGAPPLVLRRPASEDRRDQEEILKRADGGSSGPFPDALTQALAEIDATPGREEQ